MGDRTTNSLQLRIPGCHFLMCDRKITLPLALSMCVSHLCHTGHSCSSRPSAAAAALFASPSFRLSTGPEVRLSREALFLQGA